MKRNLGTVDRLSRLVGVGALAACAVFAPFPLLVRVLAFGVTGCYLLLTALSGTCLGYKLLGKSSCPLADAPGER